MSDKTEYEVERVKQLVAHGYDDHYNLHLNDENMVINFNPTPALIITCGEDKKLEFYADGKIFWNSRLIEEDREIVQALRNLVRGVTSEG